MNEKQLKKLDKIFGKKTELDIPELSFVREKPMAEQIDSLIELMRKN